MKKIIALTGPKGSGKSTIAKCIKLAHPSAIIYSFAGALKQMLRDILPPEAFTPDGKEDETYGLCGKSPRYLMQTLGTEWGRLLVGEDVWVEVMRRHIQTSSAQLILIDDLRFENEAELVDELRGSIYLVSREGHAYSGEHVSEKPIHPDWLAGTLSNELGDSPEAIAKFLLNKTIGGLSE